MPQSAIFATCLPLAVASPVFAADSATTAASPALPKSAASSKDTTANGIGQALPPTAVQDYDGEILLLEASVNGTPADQVLTVRLTSQGALQARGDDLRRLRFRLDPAMAGDSWVTLDGTSGILARYDEARQTVALTAPDTMLVPYDVRLADASGPINPRAIRSLPGMLLNYDLYATYANDGLALSGTAEAMAMTGLGLWSTSGAFNSQRAHQTNHVVRLDSSWRYIDVAKVRSYVAGDFVSNALSWTGSVRLGGIQIASNFEQRPDIVTTALPQLSGSAALPSTLDLYVDQLHVFSGQIPSGPFDVRTLPSMSGTNVTLTTTDIAGRQVQLTKSYYYVADQLRSGLVEYSLDIGVPRLAYGQRSFDYDRIAMASGSVRYGVTDQLTAEAHAEGSSDGLINAGIGGVVTVGGTGAVSGSFAASRYRSSTGAKYKVQIEGALAGVRFYAGTERTLGNYVDLGRVSILRAGHDKADSGLPSVLTARATSIDRAGLAFSPRLIALSVNLDYNAIRSPGQSQRLLSLTMSQTITNRASFYVSAYVDTADRKSYGIFGSLTVRFGRSTSVSVGAQNDRGRMSYVAEAQGEAGQRQGDVSWGVSDREYQDGDGSRSAYLGYRSREALIRAQVDQSGNRWRGSIDVQGAIIATGDGVFTADRIGDGFVIVRHAGPGAEVLQGGVRMGKASNAGSFLLPDVQPYTRQQFFIDPATLSDDWLPASTEQVAVTAYRRGTAIDFGVKRSFGALVVLYGADGKPLPVGFLAKLDSGGIATVGYGGEVYFTGLQPHNRLSVDLGPAGSCRAEFDYAGNGASQPRIGPVACR